MADGHAWEDDPELRAEAKRLREAHCKTKANGAYANGQDAETDDAETSLWIDDGSWTEADIPARPWVAPGYALRGAITLVPGPPSAAKSLLMLAWACAVALGRRHGEFQPTEAGVAMVYNVEDDNIEQRRRLSATLRQFGATPEDIVGKVIRAGPSGIGTLFVRNSETGTISPTPAMDRLHALIVERQPSVLIADPLAELHGADENDNTALRAVIAAFRTLAGEFSMAVVLIHHTRKGSLSPGDPDSARGASAMIGAARIVKTLLPMSEDDAQTLGIAPDRKTRAAYVRLDDAKQNYASIEDAVWYERKPYRLDNGEIVPAMVPWKAPDLWEGISTPLANKILDEIAAGIDGGKRQYSDANAAADRAVWPVVQRHVPSLNEKQCKLVIKTWIENRVLLRTRYDDPVDRKERGGIAVGHRPGSAN